MSLVLRTLLVPVVAALALAACTPFSSGATPSASPDASPSPTANPADSKAADLRTQLDLLLGEHVMVVAKQAVAAANHTNEYSGYLTLLSTNANSLTAVMRSAFGNTSATQFDQVWAIKNGYLVDYTIGLVTHNQNKSNGAMSGLVNGYVPQFAQLVSSLTQIQVGTLTELETKQIAETAAIIDAEVAQSYTNLFAAVRAAYTNSAFIGDALATRMAQLFPDKFPGDPSISAVDARVALNGLLQEHAYLSTMACDAGVAGRGAEAAAALGALAGARSDLGPVMGFLRGPDARSGFAQLWATRDADLFGYAGSGDASARERLTGAFVTQFSAMTQAPAAAVRDQVVALLKAVDDQRTKAYANLATDDRAAASAVQPIADGIT